VHAKQQKETPRTWETRAQCNLTTHQLERPLQQGNYAPIERSLRAKILEITRATLIISPQKKAEKCSFGFYI
jgi:hypothetical protein